MASVNDAYKLIEYEFLIDVKNDSKVIDIFVHTGKHDIG